MSYFSSEWIARASRLFGAAPSIRVSVRGPETGSTVTIVTAVEDVLDLSPIVIEREREFAVIQGQAWQVTFTNLAGAQAVRAATGGWARLEIGYPDDDVWATMAVGTIEDLRVTSGGTISLDVEDQMVALVNAKLKRPIRFQDTPWVSEITSVTRDPDSSDYDNNATGAGCAIASGDADIVDEDFHIVFTSATAFKIVLPSGDDSQTGSISADCTFTRDGGSGSILVNKEGWSTVTDAYTAGDEFMLTTAAAREAYQLGAIGMIWHLIKDMAGIEVYDFDTDAMVLPFYDTANWSALIDDTIYDTCFGTFAKGDSIIDLIQGILPLHISLFPRPDGKIAVWYMLPAEGGGRVFNGNHDGGDVHIMSSTSRDTMESVYNRIVYKYRARGSGAEAVYETAVAGAPGRDRPLEIDTPWEINPLSIVTAADRAKVRFQDVQNPYIIQTPFVGATADVGETVVINDASIGADLEQVGVTKVRIDPLRATAEIEAILETITLGDYFQIAADDESSGNQIGDVGDPGAGRIY